MITLRDTMTAGSAFGYTATSACFYAGYDCYYYFGGKT